METKQALTTITVPDDESRWEREHDQAVIEARCKFIDACLVKTHDMKAEMLSVLLSASVVFVNAWHWKDEWPDEAKRATALCVNCNDIFVWGCADGEDMFYADIADVYAHWRKDSDWGSSVWCIKRRKKMPQKPVENMIRKAAIWDLDSMGLDVNAYEKYLQSKRVSVEDPPT